MPDFPPALFLFPVMILLLPQRLFAGTESSNISSPRPIVIGQPIQPEDENQSAEVEGVVTFLGREGRAVYMDVSSEAGSVPVTVARASGYLPDLLLNSRVRARGRCAAIQSVGTGERLGSLVVSNLIDVTILQLPEETWQRYPVRALASIGETNASNFIAHLRGTIHTVEQGKCFSLEDGDRQLVISSSLAVPDLVGTNVEVLGGWQQRGSNRTFEAAIFRKTPAATNQAVLPVLTKSEQIRWLKPDEAERRFPVKLRGVITYIGGTRKGANLDDGTGSTFLWQFDSARGSTKVKQGDFCEVDGLTSRGQFSPQVYPSNAVVLGIGELPAPAHPSWDELIHGGLDAQWVEIEGVVLSASRRNFEIEIKGGAHISCFGAGAEHLLGAIVRVRGVVLPIHNNQRRIIDVRINVPSARFISVEVQPPEDPFSLPLIHAADLFIYHPGQSDLRQVKVSGQVTAVRNGVCHMIDGTNGLRIVCRDKADPAVGDMVEAVGFPDLDSPFDKPILTIREAIWRSTGHGRLPAPTSIAIADLPGRQYDSIPVELQSRLLNVSDYGTEKVFELQSGPQIYRARLNLGSMPVMPLRLGSVLDLTGVYVVTSGQPVPFELLLNSGTDIRLLHLPSWWTVQHAIIVVSGLIAIIVLALVWIGLLHRQVEKRTAQLSEANTSLKMEITERKRAEDELVQTRLQHAVEKERTRIARDLHDDLGSRVTRTVLLLDELALQDQIPAADAPEHPREISTAAREIIQSLDETVWAVNPRNDTLPRLINYLSQFAIEFLKVANVRCRLDFPDFPPARPVSAEARHNIFLAVKEALNNAVRHANATEVRLRSAVENGSLTLTVEDDGRGFRPMGDDPSADGLRNMRQRMEEIGGKFQVESEPGKGTRISLTYLWPDQK